MNQYILHSQFYIDILKTNKQILLSCFRMKMFMNSNTYGLIEISCLTDCLLKIVDIEGSFVLLQFCYNNKKIINYTYYCFCVFPTTK